MKAASQAMACAALALGIATSAAASSQTISAYMDAPTYRGWSESNRAAYVMGVVDGFTVSFFSQNKAFYRQWAKCTDRFNGRALMAIVDVYVDRDGIAKKAAMSESVYNAVTEVCGLDPSKK